MVANTTKNTGELQQQAPQAKKKVGKLSILHIFAASKNTVATHPKLCLQLIKIYQKANFDEFFAEFVDLLKVCLVVGEKQPQVERTLSFVARFTTVHKTLKEDEENKEDRQDKNGGCKNKDATIASSDAEDDEVDPFLINMFQFLLSNHEANSNSVRYRVCQLINRILNSMGESASLDDELFSTIYDTMLQRLMDKKPAVRVQAILALNRLQDPRDKDCPVTKAYRYHLSMDPSSDVRRAALISTAITFQTLPDVLQRTRDKNPLVRRQAYLVLAQKVHIRSLQISQRVRLLSEGLNDRSDLVRSSVQKNLLQGWLRFVDGSVLDLLTCLDVEASTKGAGLALDTLFIDVPAATLVQNFGLLAEDKLLPYNDLKPESVLYWKCLVKHLKKECADEELDLMLPDLSAFCTYTRAFATSTDHLGDATAADAHATAVRQMEKEFVLQQLLQITACYDLSDEVGRQSLDGLVRTLLVCEQVRDASINVLVDVFGRLYPPNSRVQQLAEIISDIREPAPTAAEQQMSVVAEDTNITESTIVEDRTVDAAPTRPQLSEEQLRANKIKEAKVRVQLNEIREELEECVRSLDLDRAQELKLKLRTLEEEQETLHKMIATPVQTPRLERSSGDNRIVDTPSVSTGADVANISVGSTTVVVEEQQEQPEKDDPQTLGRCLTIVCQMLKSPEITIVTPTLHSLHDNLLLPCLKNQEPFVRKLAVQALSLLCLVSKELAQKHLLLFVQISSIDTESIQLLALQAVFDMFLLYGVEQFTAATQDATQLPLLLTAEQQQDPNDLTGLDATNTVIAILSKRLESKDTEIRAEVAMGLCKLLQASRITSVKLVSQLTLLWYNPNTEDDNKLRHMLGVFFPLYASLGGRNQDCICASVLPTLRALTDVHAKDPLAQVDVDDVANFLVSITSSALVSSKAKQHVNLHDSLVFSICSEVLAYPDEILSRHLIKMLRHLQLSPTNFTNLAQISTLTEKMIKKIRERPLLLMIERFQSSIREHLKNAPVKEEKEDKHDETGSTTILATDLADCTEADVTLANKTTDTTFAKRKRQLYTIHSDADLLSSEAESEIGVSSPRKKLNIKKEEKVKKAEKDEDAEALKVEETGTDSDDSNNVTVIAGNVYEQELELQVSTNATLNCSKTSEDMFVSSDLSEAGSPGQAVTCVQETEDTEAGSEAKSLEDTDGQAVLKNTELDRQTEGLEDTDEEIQGNSLDDTTSESDAEVLDDTVVEQDTSEQNNADDKPLSDSDEGGDTVNEPATRMRRSTRRISEQSPPRNRRSAKTRAVASKLASGLRGRKTVTETDSSSVVSSPVSRSGRTSRSNNRSILAANDSSTDDDTSPLPDPKNKRSALTRASTTSSNPATNKPPASSSRKSVKKVTSSSSLSDEKSPVESPSSSVKSKAAIIPIGKLSASKKSETIGKTPSKSSLSSAVSSPSASSVTRSTRNAAAATAIKGLPKSPESDRLPAATRRTARGKPVSSSITSVVSTETNSADSNDSISPARPATKRLKTRDEIPASNSTCSTSDSCTSRLSERSSRSNSTVGSKSVEKLQSVTRGSALQQSPTSSSSSRSTRATRRK